MQNIHPTRRGRSTVYLNDGRNNAFNFINTRKKDYKGNYKDSLFNYEVFLNWCEQTGVICYDRYLQLELEMRCYEAEAVQVFDQVVATRNCLTELFNCMLSATPIHEHVLYAFNRMVAEVHAHLQYQLGEHGLEQFWLNINEELKTPLWFIMSEAMLLIDQNKIKHAKKCPLCGSLFLDESRTSNRIWCNPRTCGSIRKSLSYYSRKNAVLQAEKQII